MRTRRELRQIADGQRCPECDNRERSTIEDNGEKGSRLSYCCTKCGEQWDRDFWREKLEDRA